ncbi:hypothetical protein HYS84_03505 [Candidatus Saccharibacteria bacterium]|nr:hypothetical protein [Candidatus Saccharibacteria bacterium]
MNQPLTVHLSPFTVRYPFSVIHDQWLIVNGKCMACPALEPEWSSLQSDYGTSSFNAGVKGKSKMVNGAGGAL